MSISSSDASSFKGVDVESSAGKSSSENSSTGHTGGSSNDNSAEKDEQLAQAETQAVFRLRLLFFFILFVAAAGVSAFVYMLTNNAENDEFSSQFQGSATTVVDTFVSILETHLGAVSTVSVATVAHSIDHYREWPFISLSFIQQRFSKTNQIAGSLYLEFNPFVTEENKLAWEDFTNTKEDRQWIKDGLEYQEVVGLNQLDEMTADDPLNEDLVGSRNLTYDTPEGEVERDRGGGPFLPVWQTSPVLRQGLVNKNRWHDPEYRKWANFTLTSKAVIMSGMKIASPGFSNHPNKDTQFFATILSMNRGTRTEYLGDPMTDIFIPVFDSFHKGRKTVALLRAVFHWKSYFRKLLPPNTPDIYLVLHNSCEGSFTYVLMGDLVEPVGEGDLHDEVFSYLEYKAAFEHENIGDGSELGLKFNQEECQYSLSVYPTQDYYDTYNTNKPMVMTVTIAMIFVFTTVMFLFYDRLVERRQSLVLRKATQSTAIVSSLFPKNVRDRLLQENESDRKRSFIAPNHRLKNFLGGEEEAHDEGAHAIADLFPNCTVMFADIVGFTAWSSARDPSQVFDLLQTIYQSFDHVAKRRSVFKVETIGDCYVAVTGLPDRQADHAVRMAKFSAECRGRLNQITKSLETTLGPDTGDLGMRFGLHSGPVTAGVLRGDRSRFQLFGDTVNTAARMESTGSSNKIQISQSTAELLIKANKQHWVTPREDAVAAKGKGVLTTYWMDPQAKHSSAANSEKADNNEEDEDNKEAFLSHVKDEDLLDKEGRRIDWITGLLAENIQRVVARREALHHHRHRHTSVLYEPREGQVPLDEVVTKMVLSKFDMKAVAKEQPFSAIKLDPEVMQQLRDYVAEIATRYRMNPFHNFEHACHVTMSVIKLLKRIVTPELDVNQFRSTDLASQLHDYTYGITSDPIAILAIIFSALIHDVDHRGVSNAQLNNEEPEMSSMYRSKSIAEQNSLDVAWDILMRHQYSDLRNCMFASEEEIAHFRQVVVNVVLATDIFDKELNSLRTDRWNQAFAEELASQAEDKDLKATIVIEHIIQASDVAHTMQHWHIYRRWNERLFKELSLAYKAGRMGADPATFWYQGELSFFDNYIIPLAKKLKDCGVFGVSSDEYLTYAILNREEWQEKGEAIVAALEKEMGSSTNLIDASRD